MYHTDIISNTTLRAITPLSNMVYLLASQTKQHVFNKRETVLIMPGAALGLADDLESNTRRHETKPQICDLDKDTI